MIDKFDAESALACACDLVNTWCRESGVEECKDPYAHDVALRDTINDLWAVLSDRNSRLRAENERLRGLLTPCRPDTDAQTDASYPKTVNDVLHLLSCYWADFLPDDVELSDEYYAAWERQARPVIERMTDRTCDLRNVSAGTSISEQE